MEHLALILVFTLTLLPVYLLRFNMIFSGAEVEAKEEWKQKKVF